MRSVGQVIKSTLALAMATASTGGGMRRQVLHTGAGVARREAYHARRADERSVLEEVDAEAVLRAEASASCTVSTGSATSYRTATLSVRSRPISVLPVSTICGVSSRQ